MGAVSAGTLTSRSDSRHGRHRDRADPGRDGRCRGPFPLRRPRLDAPGIPPSLEVALSGYVDENRGDLEGKRIVIDLADVPVVSSRHLGIMMTIQKVAQTIGRVELDRVSQGVHDLLTLTKMAGYFNLPE